MARRTSISDADRIDTADDLEHVVLDKRAAWRANDARARRRQRRYKQLLTRQLLKRGATGDDSD